MLPSLSSWLYIWMDGKKWKLSNLWQGTNWSSHKFTSYVTQSIISHLLSTFLTIRATLEILKLNQLILLCKHTIWIPEVQTWFHFLIARHLFYQLKSVHSYPSYCMETTCFYVVNVWFLFTPKNLYASETQFPFHPCHNYNIFQEMDFCESPWLISSAEAWDMQCRGDEYVNKSTDQGKRKKQQLCINLQWPFQTFILVHFFKKCIAAWNVYHKMRQHLFCLYSAYKLSIVVSLHFYYVRFFFLLMNDLLLIFIETLILVILKGWE